MVTRETSPDVYSTKSAISSAFNIEVRFVGGLSARQRAAFSAAANRWSRMIVGNLPPVNVEGDRIDDLLIMARGSNIDGRGGILGQAGPTHLRPRTFLPAKGIMSFDIADLSGMEKAGTLGDVICHEMGHVIGIGTIWGKKRLLRGAGTKDPTFTGKAASREYGALKGPESTAVPVANSGGAGTRDAHWREGVFANELMSGFISSRGNPISRVTVGSLQDVGYVVDLNAAEPYGLPTLLELNEFGLSSALRADDHGGHGTMFIPDQDVLPEDSLL